MRKPRMRTKSKSKSRRSLKGGSPQPYVYEGVELKEGNDLIQLAVTRMDDGTYTFNPIGQNFSNYCKLAEYYCSKKSLACVNSSIPSKSGEMLLYPSLIQLLGLSLILAHKNNVGTALSTSISDSDVRTIFLKTLQQLKISEPLFKSTTTGCISYDNSDFFKISSLNDLEVNAILTIMKKFMFFSKYIMVPVHFLDLLTFNKILYSDTTDAITHIMDRDAFITNTNTSNFKLHKTNMFTPDQLREAAASQPSSAVPASSAPMASSLEDRVATLEREVAELKKAVAQ